VSGGSDFPRGARPQNSPREGRKVCARWIGLWRVGMQKTRVPAPGTTAQWTCCRRRPQPVKADPSPSRPANQLSASRSIPEHRQGADRKPESGKQSIGMQRPRPQRHEWQKPPFTVIFPVNNRLVTEIFRGLDRRTSQYPTGLSKPRNPPRCPMPE